MWWPVPTVIVRGFSITNWSEDIICWWFDQLSSEQKLCLRLPSANIRHLLVKTASFGNIHYLTMKPNLCSLSGLALSLSTWTVYDNCFQLWYQDWASSLIVGHGKNNRPAKLSNTWLDLIICFKLECNIHFLLPLNHESGRFCSWIINEVRWS